MLAQRAHGQGPGTDWCVAPDVPRHLRGDPGRLRQILANLVGNAVKFTDARRGRACDVACSGETDDAMCVCASRSATPASAFPKAQAPALQAFTQADASTTRKYGGTGLGPGHLQTAGRADGRAGSGSRAQPGKGSTFWFTARFEQADPRGQTRRSGARISQTCAS